MFVPTPKAEEFKELKSKKTRAMLDERIALYQQQKRIALRLDALNFELFGELQSVLPENVKSIEYEGHTISAYQSKPQFRLDQNKLLKKTFKCGHCKESLTLPAKVLEACKKQGKVPKPTVSVRVVGEKDEE